MYSILRVFAQIFTPKMSKVMQCPRTSPDRVNCEFISLCTQFINIHYRALQKENFISYRM